MTTFKWLNTDNLELPFDVLERMTDDEISEAIKVQVDYAAEMAGYELEEKLEKATYPRFGYTTAQVFEDQDTYETWLREIMKEEVEALENQWFNMVKEASANLED